MITLKYEKDQIRANLSTDGENSCAWVDGNYYVHFKDHNEALDEIDRIIKRKQNNLKLEIDCWIEVKRLIRDSSNLEDIKKYL